jgi:atypical dual specificity phosphatase
MQRLHPEQQNSSLGISKALNEEVRLLEENVANGIGQGSNANAIKRRSTLTDAMFKQVPTSEANIFTWTRFIISLYYNKVTFWLLLKLKSIINNTY